MDVSLSHDPFLPDSDVEPQEAEPTIAEQLAAMLTEGLAKTQKTAKGGKANAAQ